MTALGATTRFLAGNSYRDRLEHRRLELDAASRTHFDVAVVGGGITGASLFRRLTGAGYRVLLVENGDFASATSQASAMMIWGGLLYLRQRDLMTVLRLSAARDRLIRDRQTGVESRRFIYLSRKGEGFPPWVALAALRVYWLLGGLRRRRPGWLSSPLPEQSFLRENCFHPPLHYEEGWVNPSDCRFVLQHILDSRGQDSAAFNYCRLADGMLDLTGGGWRLELEDRILDRRCSVRCCWVINAAGVWVDQLNERLGISSPVRHLPSKGVFLGLRRLPGHRDPLILDTGRTETSLALIPWGPLSLWGPTENRAEGLEAGFSVEPRDVRFLLAELRRHVSIPVGVSDIVSFRNGVRPLPLHRSSACPDDLMDLSRRYLVETEERRQWISVYGGKLTGAGPLGDEVVKRLVRRLLPSSRPTRSKAARPVPMIGFPGLAEPVPDPHWCASEEMCWTLEDYLRRRSNISQWVARGGLGARDVFADCLVQMARHFSENRQGALQRVDEYRRQIEQTFDRVLAQVRSGDSL